MIRIFVNYNPSSGNLYNKGDLEFIFLGNGAALNQNQYNNNIIVIKGGSHVLLDCGITAPTAFKQYLCQPLHTVKNIAISHLHADHFGGLECFAWHNIINQSRPTLWSKVDVWDAVKSGLAVFNGKSTTINDFFRMGRIQEDDSFKTGDLKVKFIKTRHIEGMNSYGYVIDDRILFTMDSLFDISFFKDEYDLIFHDCTTKPSATHASIQELMTLPKEIKNKMYLMHVDAGWYDITDFRGIVPQGVRIMVD